MIRRWKWITKLANENGWKYGAEIGVQKGNNLFYILNHCPELHMIGVDVWALQPDKGPGFAYNRNKHIHASNFNMVKEKAKHYPGRLWLLKMLSVNAAKYVKDGCLDFVFIDADHSRQAVKDDIIAWKPKLKETGFLCGHDAGQKKVKKALDAMVPGWKYWGPQYDNCWSERKNV